MLSYCDEKVTVGQAEKSIAKPKPESAPVSAVEYAVKGFDSIAPVSRIVKGAVGSASVAFPRFRYVSRTSRSFQWSHFYSFQYDSSCGLS
ncbi:hypothetical protein BKA82DRAFT_1004873 [Pisolithus tinctorius]|uniref:Uncharacterized protein n=1 Tax=Pisolithus tinctorius Marx 270 TaxID=870435 RepID=A0A0C3NDL2_PISTI|nr:hypothetical protein BKA82DRAFT_1004873 [Pisolithus tinctorius]KIN99194.1 hypothetical protein M404DRAFT_1004873 [Pisolithus tinctorius Marx 270]